MLSRLNAAIEKNEQSLSDSDSTIYRQQIKKFEIEFSFLVEQIKHLIVYELEQAKKGIREVPQEQNDPIGLTQ